MGNEAFRKAKFSDAKRMYYLSLEKLKLWNEFMHPDSVQETKDVASLHEQLKSPPPTPQSPDQGVNIQPSQADKENNPNEGPNENIEASYVTAAIMNLGMIQFIEGCYKDSIDLLHKALEKHRQYSHPFYSRREERTTSKERSYSTSTVPLSTAQEPSSPSLTSLSILIKRDLSLINAHANERVIVSRLNEFSTLDAMIADLLNNLAACYEVMGDLEMAKTLFHESLQLRIVSNFFISLAYRNLDI